jgi:hypothetical protein
MHNRRRETPGRLGSHPQHYCTPVIGGTGVVVGGAAPITANTTNIIHRITVGGPAIFFRVSATVNTVPVDADGTLLLSVRKWNGAAYVTLSQTIDLETLVSRVARTALFLSGLNDAQLSVNPGDTLEVVVVSNSAAIDTQPAGLAVTVEVHQLD